MEPERVSVSAGRALVDTACDSFEPLLRVQFYCDVAILDHGHGLLRFLNNPGPEKFRIFAGLDSESPAAGDVTTVHDPHRLPALPPPNTRHLAPPSSSSLRARLEKPNELGGWLRDSAVAGFPARDRHAMHPDFCRERYLAQSEALSMMPEYLAAHDERLTYC